jgi:hypothetical protein
MGSLAMAAETSPASVWQSDALSVITWLVTSAGLTGTLIAIGYIVYSAHAEFLGMIVHDLTATEYLRVAGGFLLAVTLQYVTLAGDLWDGVATHWVLAVGALIIAGTVAYVVRGAGLRAKLRSVRSWCMRLRPYTCALATLVMLLSVAKAAYFDLPAAHISGVLLGAIECNKNWNLPVGIENRTTKLWHDIVCSRAMPLLAGQSSAASGCSCEDQETHLRRLRRGFVAAVSWAGLLIAASVVLARWAIRAEWRGFEGTGAARAFILAMAVLGVVNIALVPYYYGKVLYPTRFSIGDVAVDDGTFKGYILSVGPDAVTIFESGEKAIISLPRKHLKEIRMVDIGDVMLSRMDYHPAPQTRQVQTED